MAELHIVSDDKTTNKQRNMSCNKHFHIEIYCQKSPFSILKTHFSVVSDVFVLNDTKPFVTMVQRRHKTFGAELMLGNKFMIIVVMQ